MSDGATAGDPQHYMDLAIRFCDRLEHLKALDCFRKAEELAESKGNSQTKLDAAFWAARCLSEEGRGKEALPIWEQVIGAGTGNIGDHDYLIGHYAHAGQHEDALRIWELRRTRFPDARAAFSLSATVAESLLHLDRADEAARLYSETRETVQVEGQRNGWVWEKEGRALLKLGRPLESAEAFLRGMHATGHAESYTRTAGSLYAWTERALRAMSMPKSIGYMEELAGVLASAGLDAAIAKVRADRPPEPPPEEAAAKKTVAKTAAKAAVKPAVKPATKEVAKEVVKEVVKQVDSSDSSTPSES